MFYKTPGLAQAKTRSHEKGEDRADGETDREGARDGKEGVDGDSSQRSGDAQLHKCHKHEQFAIVNLTQVNVVKTGSMYLIPVGP